MTEVDQIIARARKKLKENNSQKDNYKLNDGFISTFIRGEKEETIKKRTSQISKRHFFDSDFDHPFWTIVIGVFVCVFVAFPILIFILIFDKLGVRQEAATILALVCSMLLGILLASTQIENEVTQLRKSAFEAGMVFESEKHIEEYYAKAVEKTNS